MSKIQHIQMVDLKSQYLNIKNEIDHAMQQVIYSTQFVKGEIVKEFEKNLQNYLEVKHVIACANGTDALQIALMALNINPGDEIIVPDFTFISPAEVGAFLGLTPVFVDVDPDTFNMNPEEIEKKITKKTKAIIPVHLFGQCCEMNKILELAKKHNISIIEDVAQAIGADYIYDNQIAQKAGTIGDIGCTSFFPSKNLGCFGDGGAVFTNNDELAAKIRTTTNHGMKVRYYYDEIGINSRLDSIQAAILDVKLKYLEKYHQSRQQAAYFYDKTFSGHSAIQTPVRAKNSTHIFHQYTIILNKIDRNTLQEYLKEKGIPSMIYYPVPIHKQKPYMKFVTSSEKFTVSEQLCKNVLSLPMHSELDEEQLNYITSTLLDFKM